MWLVFGQLEKCGGDICDNVFVGQHDALRVACGTRGITDGAEVARLGGLAKMMSVKEENRHMSFMEQLFMTFVCSLLLGKAC